MLRFLSSTHPLLWAGRLWAGYPLHHLSPTLSLGWTSILSAWPPNTLSPCIHLLSVFKANAKRNVSCSWTGWESCGIPALADKWFRRKPWKHSLKLTSLKLDSAPNQQTFLRFQAKGHVRITHGLLLVHCISTQERLQAVALAARTNGYLHSFVPFEYSFYVVNDYAMSLFSGSASCWKGVGRTKTNHLTGSVTSCLQCLHQDDLGCVAC